MKKGDFWRMGPVSLYGDDRQEQPKEHAHHAMIAAICIRLGDKAACQNEGLK